MPLLSAVTLTATHRRDKGSFALDDDTNIDYGDIFAVETRLSHFCLPPFSVLGQLGSHLDVVTIEDAVVGVGRIVH